MVLELLVVLGAAALVVYWIYRFPDSRERLGPNLDDALYRGVVRALWLFVAIAALAVLAVWLLL